MEKSELISKLKKLAKKKKKKVLTLTDIKSEKKLVYHLYEHYDSVADALEDAGLQASKLARRMRMTDDELLKYIYELGKELERQPTHKDIRKKGRHYKIYQIRFGSVKKAYERALYKYGSPDKSNKETDNKLPKIDYKGLFYGSAGEYYVIAELLYRGYIAQKMPIDLGLDVYATKRERVFFFQVKNVSFDKSKIRHVSITTSSFLKNQKTNVFYVFVIQKSDYKKSLIIDYLTMRRLKKEGFINEEGGKNMIISLKRESNTVFVFKKDNPEIKKNMANYIEDWGAIV